MSSPSIAAMGGALGRLAVPATLLALVAWYRRRRLPAPEEEPPARPTRPAPRAPKPRRDVEVFICLDFEWTCDDGEERRVHSDDVEIIERPGELRGVKTWRWPKSSEMHENTWKTWKRQVPKASKRWSFPWFSP